MIIRVKKCLHVWHEQINIIQPTYNIVCRSQITATLRSGSAWVPSLMQLPSCARAIYTMAFIRTMHVAKPFHRNIDLASLRFSPR